MPGYLLLIRHATNPWVGKRLAGWTPGVLLDEAGEAEARALAERLSPLPLAAVYSSPLERAWQTATAIVEGRSLDILPLPAVGEVEFGGWTGAEMHTLRDDPLWPVVQHMPSLARFPDGESIAQAQARAVAGLESVRAAHPEAAVAVVSHADIIKAVVAFYVGMALDQYQRLVVDTASVTILAFVPEGVRLLAFNHRGPLELPPPPPEAGAEQTEAADGAMISAR